MIPDATTPGESGVSYKILFKVLSLLLLFMWFGVCSRILNRILKNSPQTHTDFSLSSLTFSALTELQFHTNIIQIPFHIQSTRILHLLEKFAEKQELNFDSRVKFVFIAKATFPRFGIANYFREIHCSRA